MIVFMLLSVLLLGSTLLPAASAAKSSSVSAAHATTDPAETTTIWPTTESSSSKSTKSKTPKASKTKSPSSDDAWSSSASPSTSIVTVTADQATQTGVVNGAKIFFPSAAQWWVVGAVDVVQWTPAMGVAVDLILTNLNTTLLPAQYPLAKRVPPAFTQMALSAAEPILSGGGYVLVMSDSASKTIYSESEPFEIKPEGQPGLTPAGFTIKSEPTSVGASSEGTRTRSPRGTAWAAAAIMGVLGGAML